MNHEIEFTRFACSRSKFSIFSLEKKKNVSSAGLLQTRNKIQGICHCLPADPTCIFSFLALVTKKVEKIRTMSREERHTENLFLGFYNVV